MRHEKITTPDDGAGKITHYVEYLTNDAALGTP